MPAVQFDHVTEKPLSRETWLTYATPSAGRDWILVNAMPEAFYLAGLRVANSRSAMKLALALVFSLVLAAALASMVTAPLRLQTLTAVTSCFHRFQTCSPACVLFDVDRMPSVHRLTINTN